MNLFYREWMCMEYYAYIIFFIMQLSLSFNSVIQPHTQICIYTQIFPSIPISDFSFQNCFINRTYRRSTHPYAKHGQMGTVSTEPLVSHIWSLYLKTAKNYIGNHPSAYIQVNIIYSFSWINDSHSTKLHIKTWNMF